MPSFRNIRSSAGIGDEQHSYRCHVRTQRRSVERQGQFARKPRIQLRSAKTQDESAEEDERLSTVQEADRDSRLMKIEGSVRSNLISAITSVRRWRGRPVHKDTLTYWQAVLEHGRRSIGEPVGELVAELEDELAQAQRTTRSR